MPLTRSDMDHTVLPANTIDGIQRAQQRSAIRTSVYCIYSAKSNLSSNIYSWINLGMIHWIRSGTYGSSSVAICGYAYVSKQIIRLYVTSRSMFGYSHFLSFVSSRFSTNVEMRYYVGFLSHMSRMFKEMCHVDGYNDYWPCSATDVYLFTVECRRPESSRSLFYVSQ